MTAEPCALGAEALDLDGLELSSPDRSRLTEIAKGSGRGALMGLAVTATTLFGMALSAILAVGTLIVAALALVCVIVAAVAIALTLFGVAALCVVVAAFALALAVAAAAVAGIFGIAGWASRGMGALHRRTTVAESADVARVDVARVELAPDPQPSM